MCGFVREIDRENEERAELKALAGIIEEHKHWANIFGVALVRALQKDYSEVDRLVRDLKIEFPGCEPHVKSAAFEEARKVGIPC